MDQIKEDYRNKWARENRARIIVMTTPADKEEIKAAANQAGQSVNAYILQAVRERIEREKPLE